MEKASVPLKEENSNHISSKTALRGVCCIIVLRLVAPAKVTKKSSLLVAKSPAFHMGGMLKHIKLQTLHIIKQGFFPNEGT